MNRGAPMGKVKSFLNSKIVKKDVGEPTYLTWKEALSYAMGRGAQGMSTSMTASKYVNFLLPMCFISKQGTQVISGFIAVFLMRLTTR